MRLLRVPPSRRVWIFDLDNTLYPLETEFMTLIEGRMTDFMEKVTGLPRDEAGAIQKKYYHEHGTTLAGLMASFEQARPGGSNAQALHYFDQAIALAGGVAAAPLVAKAEGVAQPGGDRAGFEALLRQALAVAASHPDLQNAVMRERAEWLLDSADDLF